MLDDLEQILYLLKQREEENMLGAHCIILFDSKLEDAEGKF